MDASERVLMAITVRDALGGTTNADEALHNLGWLDLLEAEPDDALAIVFGALGAANVSASALDDVVVAALGITPHPDRAALLPPYGSWERPSARGVATARVVRAAELVVGGAMVSASRATTTPIGGIDPDAALYSVVVEADAAADGEWEYAVARSQRAVAHQIAGATRAMLDLARQHALDRVQFGTPIVRFQAVRHRLADALVAIEALDAALDAAADVPGTETAALAKAVAGRTARTVAAHCQQVLAGVGFTTEHPFHRYLKRTMLLDGLFGNADDLALAIGRNLLRARTVPTLVDL
jgi:hypothetical protein